MNVHEINNKMSIKGNSQQNREMNTNLTERRIIVKNRKPQIKHKRTHQKRGSDPDKNLQNIKN